MSIKLISINVRGLRDVVKRRAIFNYYRQRSDILFIQETHSCKTDEIVWESEWGGDIIYGHGETNARGVGIFLKKGMKDNVTNIHVNEDGRAIICDIKIDEYKLTLCNLYAPNKDTPSFFLNIQTELAERCENKMIIGDFNLVMNVHKDRVGTMHNKDKSLKVINVLMEELLLSEVWHAKFPNDRRFSWYKARPKLSASRIHFGIISQGLVDMCENTGYITGIHTDHLAYYLYMNLQKNERGRGYWKMNVTHLVNKDFIERMNKCLEIELNNTIHKKGKERWEYLKFKIRDEAMEYARTRASEMDLIVAQLSEKVVEMEANLENADLLLLDKTKADLNEFMLEKARRCIFKSKIKFAEMGERSTKYYLNMEKARYNARTCNALYDEDNKLVTDTNGILNLQHTFYQNLYTRDQSVIFEFKKETGIEVPESLRLQQSEMINEKEVTLAVKQLPNGKTCGNDGIPIDFYKLFWRKLKSPFMEMLQEVFNDKKLHDSALIGVLNLIPKAKKDTRFLTHMRPITLLNSDCKTIEKVIANRIEPALKVIINEDQRGFMKNRRIATNIQTIFELIKHTDKKNVDAIVLSLDFMKCFDRIEFCALLGAMEYFKFSPILIQWTQILYNEFKIVIQNNGHFSSYIYVTRGLHQGGPCSSLFFLICAEIMAIMLRDNKSVKGIPVKDFLNTLGQYADDADIFSIYDQGSINTIFQILEEFRMLSGFALNYDKTTILRIGSLKDANASLFTQRTVAWTNEPINVLGVWVSSDFPKIMDKNFNEIIEKMEKVLNKWSTKSMSLLAKVLVVNSLVISLYEYRMMVLPNISETTYRRIKNIITKFIWSGGKSKIAYDVLIQKKHDGGAGLIDLRIKNKASKITWLQILSTEKKLSNLVYENISPLLKELIWKCNLRKEHVHLFIKDTFWCQIMETWSELRHKRERKIDVGNQILWLNSDIVVDNKPIHWDMCIKKGLIYLKQLVNNGQIISAIEAERKYQLNWMNYNSIITALAPESRKSLKDTKVQMEESCLYQEILTKSNLAAMVYEELIPCINWSERVRKWSLETNSELNEEQFMKCFRNLYITTNIPRMRSFQYRLLNRGLVTNIHLKKWKIKDTDMCTFCNEEPETYCHLFIMCKKIQSIWIKTESFMMEFDSEEIEFGKDAVILDKVVNKTNSVKNMICLMLKYYIYKQRCMLKEPRFEEFKQSVWRHRTIEQYIAVKNSKIHKHIKKWGNKNSRKQMSYFEDNYLTEYMTDM